MKNIRGARMLATTHEFFVDPAWPEDFQTELEMLIDRRYTQNGLTPVACCSEVKLADYLPQLRAQSLVWDEEDHEKAFWLVKPMQSGRTVPPLVVIGGDVVDGFYRLRAMELGNIETWPAVFLPDPGL
jgi:hypothetical protein